MKEDDIIRIIETDPDNAEFIKMDFDMQLDTEYLEWYLVHGDASAEYAENYLTYSLMKEEDR